MLPPEGGSHDGIVRVVRVASAFRRKILEREDPFRRRSLRRKNKPILKVLSAEFVTSAAAQGRGDGIPADGLAHVAFAGRSNVGKSTLLNALARRTLARTSAAPGKTRLANIFRLHVEGGPGGPGRWRVYFVDLPGYGYARGGADSAKELAAVAQGYYESGRGMRDAAASAGTQFGAGDGEASPRPLRGEGGGSDGERRRRAGLGEIDPKPAPGPRVSDPGQRVPDPGAAPAKRATLLLIDARHPRLASDLQAHQWLTSIAGPPLIVATKIDKLSRSDRVRNLKELERVFGTPPLPVSAAGGEGLDALWKVIARVAREQHQ